MSVALLGSRNSAEIRLSFAPTLSSTAAVTLTSRNASWKSQRLIYFLLWVSKGSSSFNRTRSAIWMTPPRRADVPSDENSSRELGNSLRDRLVVSLQADGSEPLTGGGVA
jgi:hypothetical protein